MSDLDPWDDNRPTPDEIRTARFATLVHLPYLVLKSLALGVVDPHPAVVIPLVIGVPTAVFAPGVVAGPVVLACLLSCFTFAVSQAWQVYQHWIYQAGAKRREAEWEDLMRRSWEVEDRWRRSDAEFEAKLAEHAAKVRIP